MAIPDRSIDPRILESAKQEFLEKGFDKASLKAICEAAGVTTGALYKRYKGKEDLFCAVVSDTVIALDKFVESRLSVDPANLSDRELIESWNMEESLLAWLRFLYSYHDGFILLISGAWGTRYTNFQHDFVEKMTVGSQLFFMEAKNRGLAHADISEAEMHILCSAFWTMIYESFIHGYTWEQMEAHSKVVCKLFNWHRVFEFETPAQNSL